jgi:hypothetical protein
VPREIVARSRGEGVDDREMFAACVFQPLGHAAQVEDQGLAAQRADDLLHLRVAGGARDGGVQILVDGADLGAIRRGGGGACEHGCEARANVVEQLRRDATGGDARGLRLEQATDGEVVHEGSQVEMADLQAAAAVPADQAIALQQQQRVAQRRARHVEMLGQTPFMDHRARLQRAGHDQVQELLVGLRREPAIGRHQRHRHAASSSTPAPCTCGSGLFPARPGKSGMPMVDVWYTNA